MMLHGYCGDFSSTHIGYTRSIPAVTYSLHFLLFFLRIFYRFCLLPAIPINLKSLHPDFPINGFVNPCDIMF